jgi:hypothetical protein
LIIIHFLGLLLAGSGKKLNDVLQHGPHDLYWCYRSERGVLAYKSVKTNLKQSEVTFSKYEVRLAFLIAREKAQYDDNNLYPP